MKTKIFIAVVIVLVVVGGLAATKTLQFHTLQAAPHTPPPEAVASAVAREEKWPETLTAVGSIDPQNGVTLAAEVAGTVAEIAVADGATVAKGDLLLRLDTSTEEAQLRAAEAQVAWAKVSAERLRKLQADKTVSQSDLDQAEAALKQAQADADVIRATIGKKTLRAPFAGRLGIWLVTVGASLDARKPMISLQSLTPVYADFSLPQQNLAQLKTGLPVQVSCDVYPGEKFAGTLTAMNPDLDAATRNVLLRATFENTNQSLRPGMFVRVAVFLPEAQPVLAIPATAVLSAPFGDSVYVVETATNSAGGLVARQQIVRVGRTRGDFVSVVSGLKAGDRVVSAGAFKLRNGSVVVESNELTPKPTRTPTPSDS